MRLSPSLLAAIAFAAAGVAVALVQSLRLSWRAALPGRRLRAKAARAARGEVRAEALLARRGFSVEARQAPGRWSFAVDGEPVAVGVRADLVVTRGRRRFVAEVKTGGRAPSVTAPATRRQLLEYHHAAFGEASIDGVLLVDAEAERVVEVRFPPSGGAARDGAARRVALVLFGVAVGALLGGALARLGG